MSLRRASTAFAAMIVAASLSGCVAAIPVVAAAGLVRASTDGKEASPNDQGARADPEPMRIEQQVAPPPVVSSKSEESEKLEADDPFGFVTRQTRQTRNPASSPYASLVSYVREHAPDKAAGKPIPSAMLITPSALNAKRRPCAVSSPLVLIDLDPHEGSLSFSNLPPVAPELADGLQSLRDQGVAIAWISKGTAGDAGTIRTALTNTGLDPDARDRLILMRYPDDRKQTRRQELSREHCILAIAGDHRTDFDELYEYLVKPEAALSLEVLIGDGWFLVPPPLGKAKL